MYQVQPIGQLMVAPHTPGEALDRTDRRLLENIARQTGPAGHMTRLVTALQRSLQQLVTAREEERRRLRRDLHDGLGPHLASQTLTIAAIDKLLERDPATTRELLHHLKIQSQDAITDIRRLVYGLRPPALDQLGLVAALREGFRQTAQNGLPVALVVDPDPLPAEAAAVDVAVYRIVLEAVTNISRYAPAGQASVEIFMRDHTLKLTITDNGQGFPSPPPCGIGLTSMRERAEELGAWRRLNLCGVD